jgi:hypothetical protein
MLDAATGYVKVTAKSLCGPDALVVRMLNRVTARLWANEGVAIEAAGWKVHHEGRCGRCGAELTVPASCERGLGPVCAGYATAA